MNRFEISYRTDGLIKWMNMIIWKNQWKIFCVALASGQVASPYALNGLISAHLPPTDMAHNKVGRKHIDIQKVFFTLYHIGHCCIMWSKATVQQCGPTITLGHSCINVATRIVEAQGWPRRDRGDEWAKSPWSQAPVKFTERCGPVGNTPSCSEGLG